MKTAIRLQQIEHSFSENKVLKGIDLEIEQGGIFGLLGPSGAGKTTLIKILTGQLKPTKGMAEVLSKDVTKLESEDYQEIGIMMDNFGLYERMTCYDNLKFFCMIYKVPYNRIDEVLKAVGLSDCKKKRVEHLSKGMRNRMLIARAILSKPRVLFLDVNCSTLLKCA